MEIEVLNLPQKSRQEYTQRVIQTLEMTLTTTRFESIKQTMMM